MRVAHGLPHRCHQERYEKSRQCDHEEYGLPWADWSDEGQVQNRCMADSSNYRCADNHRKP